MTAPEKKKSAVLRASILEFAEYGYEQANTNRISQAAGVSKGLIFHYFSSKQQLYRGALDLCVRDILEYFTPLTVHDADFISGLLQYYRYRAEFFALHPYYYTLLMQAVNSPPQELRSEIGALLAPVSKLGEQALLFQFEKVRLKPSVSRESALGLLIIVLNAIESRHIPVLSDAGHLTPELYDQLEAECGALLRLVLYGIAEEEQ